MPVVRDSRHRCLRNSTRASHSEAYRCATGIARDGRRPIWSRPREYNFFITTFSDRSRSRRRDPRRCRCDIGSLYSDRPPEWGGGGRRRRQPGVMVQSLLARGPIGSQPSRLSPRLSRPARERRGFDRKGSRVRTSIRATSRSCSETATPAEGGAAMRYYIGVDWADAEHAVWVADEEGQRVSATMVPHSAVGCSEWGRQLDEWRAQGIGLWAAIERPEGRVVDFLLDHGVMV